MADSLAESVKETLVGTTIEPQLSQQFKATFDRHARRSDDEGEEPFMTEEDFVNAIAPKDEDYVRAFHTRLWPSIEPPSQHLTPCPSNKSHGD